MRDAMRNRSDPMQDLGRRSGQIERDHVESLAGLDDHVLGLTHAFIRGIDERAARKIQRDCVREKLVQIGVSVRAGRQTLVLGIADPDDALALDDAEIRFERNDARLVEPGAGRAFRESRVVLSQAKGGSQGPSPAIRVPGPWRRRYARHRVPDRHERRLRALRSQRPGGVDGGA